LDELSFDLHVPCGLSHIHGQEQHRDQQGLDRRRRDMVDPLADADADREVAGISVDRDCQGAVGVDEAPLPSKCSVLSPIISPPPGLCRWTAK
jgi:hypothetical protein